MAVQALEDVHFRGCYECLPDIILVSGAIRNSIKDAPSGNIAYSLLGGSLVKFSRISPTILVLNCPITANVLTRDGGS